MSHLQNCSLKIYLKRALGWGGGIGLWGQDGCERRIKVFVKIQKHIFFFFFFWGGGGSGMGGGQGRCVQSSEVFVKIKKKMCGVGSEGGGGGGSGWREGSEWM